MEIFALVIDGAPEISRHAFQGKFKELKIIKSIAVLPFVNMSNDPEQEYFSDGMAEEIINSLSHLKDLTVAGRTSSFQFKGKIIDLRQVGRKLSVSTVLEGSVRKQGDHLRITAQLVNVEDGFHLWSERYDRQLNDVFAIQDEIALAITEKLLDTLLKKDLRLITKNPTQNTEAYELYLKGKFHLSRRGASLTKSIRYFQQAIELDPDFALAHSGFADANFLIATYGLTSPNRVMSKARRSAERALELDPLLCEPYCSLGYYYTCVEWNWNKAKENFLTSINLNPKFAEGQMRYAWTYLTCVEGDFVKAEKHGKMALQFEPLSAICYANHSLILQNAGNFEEAVEACRTGIDIDPNSFVCHLNLATALSALQKYEEAIPVFDMAMRLSNRHTFSVNALLWTYCLYGDYKRANELMDELRTRLQTEYAPCAIMAMSSAYLGNLDEAIQYLRTAFKDRDPMLILLKYAHWVPHGLRNDARFNEILEEIGFPDVLVNS
jgi:TolB-like protein/Tfp pilus assembly protein PilF